MITFRDIIRSTQRALDEGRTADAETWMEFLLATPKKNVRNIDDAILDIDWIESVRRRIKNERDRIFLTRQIEIWGPREKSRH